MFPAISKLTIWRLWPLFAVLSYVASEEWSHHTVLDGDGRYHLYWKPPELKESDSEIVFKVELEAHGYIGFGLSPNGGMTGSDIVTGWIKDGKPYFQDRHATGYTRPKIDSKQDWFLIEGSENDTHTTLKFARKLNTCDKEDMVIDDSTLRLIYAYSEKDPEGEDIDYHKKKRGTKSAMLLQSNIHRPELNDPSLLYWDVRSPNFTIPDDDTTYWCKIYKSPELSQKHHIVYVEPLLQEGNEEFVHHLLLYECVGATPEEYDPHLDLLGHQCHRPNMPDAMKKCEGVAIAWAVGGEDIVFPEHVGLPLTPAPGKYFMMEMHYDNKWRRKGVVDSSGFRIYYTPNLRTYDAGSLMIGSTISIRAFIPPKQEEYTLAGHSNPDCLKPVMPKDGINILGVLLHSHLLGRRVKARHFRKNKELIPLALENNYDFNYQEYRYFKDEVVILPEDQITVECTYNSLQRNKTTFGGESTKEEMCLAFLLYYPHIDRYASLSVPTIPAINKVIHKNFTKDDLFRGLYQTLNNFDWESVDMEEVEERMMYSDHDTHCYLGDGEKNSVKSVISYPKKFEPYITEPSCGEIFVNIANVSRGTIKDWSFKYFYYFIWILCTVLFVS